MTGLKPTERPSLRSNGTPFSVSMWDFSWLLRRFGEEAEYSDWDKVLYEASERGYDCVRIDAFPHLVGARELGSNEERFTVLPQRRQFMWGNHRPVEVEPAPALVDFVRRSADHGIWVALSAWFNDDTTHCRTAVRTPDDFVRVWTATLDLLERQSLLERLVWVDLCNEWPHYEWAPSAHSEIFGGTSTRGAAVLSRKWTDDEVRRNEAYFLAIETLRRRYPGLVFTFSFSHYGPALEQLNLGLFDFLEGHCWLTEDPDFSTRSQFHTVADGSEQDLYEHLRLANDTFQSDVEHWLEVLTGQQDRWARLASANSDRPLVTSEGWASVWCGDVPGSQCGWEFTKAIGRAAVRGALERGWTGICTSNFSQPHFSALWGDVAWHRELTGLVRSWSPEEAVHQEAL